VRTLVIEALAPGGQARTSARIENYPGFPDGISGAELAASIHAQALRLGAEILVGVELLRARPGESGRFAFELAGGEAVQAHAAVAANGVPASSLPTGYLYCAYSGSSRPLGSSRMPRRLVLYAAWSTVS
jgi:thioredoxin reductase (NADPH)